MEKKTAKKGRFEGKQFWGCPNFPKCWKKKVYKEGDDALHRKEIVDNSRIGRMSDKEFSEEQDAYDKRDDEIYESEIQHKPFNLLFILLNFLISFYLLLRRSFSKI